MAISVTPTYLGQRTNLTGEYIRSAKLALAGLTAGAANTVPHGLPATPQKVFLEPTSNGPFYENAAADATNLYVFAQGTGTICNAYVEY